MNIELTKPEYMTGAELVKNALQLYARACNPNCSREVHERAMELNRELEARVKTVELFGSWLHHWSIQPEKQSSDVYGAWDEARERAKCSESPNENKISYDRSGAQSVLVAAAAGEHRL